MIDGHTLLADWFFLLGLIIFIVYAGANLIAGTDRIPNNRAAGILGIGLALLTAGFWVL